MINSHGGRRERERERGNINSVENVAVYRAFLRENTATRRNARPHEGGQRTLAEKNVVVKPGVMNTRRERHAWWRSVKKRGREYTVLRGVTSFPASITRRVHRPTILSDRTLVLPWKGIFSLYFFLPASGASCTSSITQSCTIWD